MRRFVSPHPSFIAGLMLTLINVRLLIFVKIKLDNCAEICCTTKELGNTEKLKEEMKKNPNS